MQAQSITATLVGTVKSSSGDPISGATVSVLRQATGTSRTATSSDRGRFAVSGLPPGSYLVSAKAGGFQDGAARTVMLTVGDRSEIALALDSVDSDATRQVVLTGEALDASPELGAVVDHGFVAELPLNGRSFQSLIAIPPGVVQTAERDQSRGSFAVSGHRASSTYFMVDGVSASFGLPAFVSAALKGNDGNAPALTASGSTAGLVPVDSMREFKVLTGSYAPEFGRLSGGQIAIATQGGSNELHGSLSHYFRNDKLDAASWFVNRDALGKPATRQNDFGGTVGGPIIKDRTFYFGAFEGFRLREPKSLSQFYPTAAARAAAVPSIRPIIDIYPVPNREDVGGGLGRYAASYSNPSELEAYSGRVDHALSGSTMLFGRYSFSNSAAEVRGNDVPVPGPISLANFLDVDTMSATIGVLGMLSESLTNDLRLNYSRATIFDETYFDDSFGSSAPDVASLLPAGRTLDDSRFIIATDSLPSIDLGRFTDSHQGQWSIVEALNWLRGSHELKFGADYRTLTPELASAAYRQIGIFGGVLGPVGLVGGSPIVTVIQQEDKAQLRFQNVSLYAQDVWRANSRLTLTYGLRWDYNPAPTGRNGFDVYPILNADDPTRLSVGPANAPLFHAPKDSFGPRLGVAYRLSTANNWGTVLRGGTGVYYDIPVGTATSVVSAAPHGRQLSAFGQPFPVLGSQFSEVPLNLEAPYGQIRGFEPGIDAPRTTSWSVGLSQGLGRSRSLQVSYVGNKGSRLWRRLGGNLSNGRVNSYELVRSDARSSYHGLQTLFEQHLRGGLQALGSYTYSHSIDDASEAATAYPWRSDGPGVNRASSDFDVRHVASGGFSYALPSPKGFLPALTRNWGVDGVWRLQTAPVVNVFSAGVSPEAVVARANVVPGQPFWLTGDQYPGGRALNRAAFEAAPAGTNGNLPRNAFRGFPLRQVDLAVRRQFQVSERFTLQLRGEMFNLLNTANFAPPNGDLLKAPFGVSTQPYSSGLGRGGLGGGQNPIQAVGGPRSVQISLRLLF